MVVFIGMESIDPLNLADVKKGFNKPEEYATVLNRLAENEISSPSLHLLSGLDNDTPGVAQRILGSTSHLATGLTVLVNSRRSLLLRCISDYKLTGDMIQT